MSKNMVMNIKGGLDKMPIQTVETILCTCTRCGHQWQPRQEDVPETCPKCKSALWNKPKKVKSKNGRKSCSKLEAEKVSGYARIINKNKVKKDGRYRFSD
jgi:DNA-directed RNA polymerase subunit M/transcription elongation factor TFIIS